MIIRDRRSGIDTRSEAEKQLMGERRSNVDRHAVDRTAPAAPPKEQLALFVRRLKRTMRDEKSRSHLGVANAEQEFAFYPDVVHVIAWLEGLSAVETEPQGRPTLRKAIPGAASTAAGQGSELHVRVPHRDDQ